MENLEKMSDRELLNLCQTYGDNAILWSRKFGALLPEVLKRGLYKKKFYSIYEFAARFAGMSQKTVDEILHVNEKLKDKPLLLAQMEEQGWSKMRVVASVATKESEKFWVKKVQILPKRALEMYISEIKKEGKEANREVGMAEKLTSGSGETLFGDAEDFLPGERILKNSQEVKFVSMSFKVDPETEFRLRKFQQKLEKEQKQTVTFNEVLKNLLDQAEENGGGKPLMELHDKKAEEKKINENREAENQINKHVSRHVSAKKRRSTMGSGKCSHSGCNKPATEIHHIDRFSIFQNHENIISLCHEHHILEHAKMTEQRVDQKYFEYLNST